MFQYTVNIDGVTASVSQLNMVLTFDKTLDYGSFVLRNNVGTAYDVGTPVDIDVTDGTTTKSYHFIISADDTTKLPNNRFLHAIDLIELTKILEWQTDSVRTFTQPLGQLDRLRLLDVVVRLQATLPVERVSDLFTTRVFALDATITQKLASVESPEFLFRNKNLKEMLEEVFDFINAIPRLTKVGNNIVLTADFFNERGSLVTTNEFSRLERFNITGFSTALDVDIKNLYDTFTSVVEPSEDGFKRLTALSGDFREDNAIFKTDFPIVEIEELIVRSKFAIPGPGGSTIVTDTFEIDLTDFILEEEEWANLNNKPNVQTFFNGQYRDNTLFYKRFSPNLTNLFEEVGSMKGVAIIGGKSRLFATLVRAAFENELTHVQGPITVDVYKAEAISDFFELEFRIKYKAQFDSRTEVKRLDTRRIKYESRSFSNQTDNVVRADRVLDRLYKMQQLLGNAEIITTERVKQLSDLHNISDYTDDDYIITTMELQFEKLYVMAKYMWTQNYQKVSDFIGLNSAIRLFDVPNDTYKRNIYLEDFIEVSTTSETTDSDMTSNAIVTFMNTFNNQPSDFYNTPVRVFAFDTKGNPTLDVGSETIIKPVAKYAGGNSINFYVEFDNPKVAGWQVGILGVEVEEVTDTENDQSDDSRNILQKVVDSIVGFFTGTVTFFQKTFRSVYKKPINNGIYYADATGQVFDFRFQFIHDVTITEPENLPVVPKNDVGVKLVDSDFYRIYKDIREEFALTYALHIMPSDGNEKTFVIGRYVTERNNLLEPILTDANQFEVFVSNTPYEIHENRFSRTTDQVAIQTYNVVGRSIQLTGNITTHPVWGIRKKANNELIIAVNQGGTPISTVYFNFLDKQSNVIYPSQSAIPVVDVARPSQLSMLTPPPTSSTIVLQWSDPNDPDANNYVAELSNNLVEWITQTVTSTTATFTNLKPNTFYTARVKTILGQLESEYQYTTGSTLDIAPDAPTGVSAILLSDRRFEVQWNRDNTVDTYLVEVSLASNFSPLITNGSKRVFGSSNRIIFDWINSSIDYDKTYYVRVKAVRSGLTSVPSSSVTVVTPEGEITSAPTITNLNVTGSDVSYTLLNTDSQLVTLFSDLSDGSIQRATNVRPNEAVQVIQSFGASDSTIFAKATAVNKEPSQVVSLQFASDEAPDAPGIAFNGITLGPGFNSVAWIVNANSPREDGFVVERNPNLDNSATFGEISPQMSPTARRYTDTAINNGQTYTYRVVAFNRIGSATSNERTVTSLDAVPATPSNLTAFALQGDPGQAFVTLTWQRNDTDEDGFIIERSTGGAFTQVGGTSKAQTTYEEVVTGSSGVTYTYRIIAYNEFGNSIASNTVSITTT